MKKIRAHKTPIRRTKTPVSIAVIGRGRLGSSYAQAIRKSSRFTLFAHLSARSRSFEVLGENEGPQIVFIVCKDSSISSVAQKAISACGQNLSIAVHSAGSLPSSILPKKENLSRLMLHPIQTFAAINPDLFKNITFGIETNDNNAVIFAKEFSKELEGKGILQLRASQLPLYHATMVIASNFITLLGGAIEKLSKQLGVKKVDLKKAVAPLMNRSLTNVLKTDSKGALTGPIARGDKTTVDKNREALKKESAVLKLYDAFITLAKDL